MNWYERMLLSVACAGMLAGCGTDRCDCARVPSICELVLEETQRIIDRCRQHREKLEICETNLESVQKDPHCPVPYSQNWEYEMVIDACHDAYERLKAKLKAKGDW